MDENPQGVRASSAELAFPQLSRSAPSGMTLRDYFAAKAMQGWLCTDDGPQTPNELAKAAYEVADAMLAARAAKEQQDG